MATATRDHGKQNEADFSESKSDDDSTPTPTRLENERAKAEEAEQTNDNNSNEDLNENYADGEAGDEQGLRSLVSLLYGGDSVSLSNWGQKLKYGVIRRVLDRDINAYAIEIIGSNISTTYINMPPGLNQNMNLNKPVLVMIVKNLKKFFAFEVMVLDNTNNRRKFRASTYQNITRLKQFLCLMPLRLEKGWNQVVFNLPDFVRRAYGTEYVSTLRLQVHANCRLRRIYFCDRPYTEQELPSEFQLYRNMTESPPTNASGGATKKQGASRVASGRTVQNY